MPSPSSERFMRVGIMRRPQRRMGALLVSIWLRPASSLHQAAVPPRFAASSRLLLLTARRLLKSKAAARAAASTSLLKASHPSVGQAGAAGRVNGTWREVTVSPTVRVTSRGAHHAPAARPLQGIWVQVTHHLSPGVNAPPGQPLTPGLPESKRGRIKPCPCHRGASS